MQQAQAIIERVRRISATTIRLDVAVDKQQRNVDAGQLFLARTTGSLDPYLREPWTPVRRDGTCLIVERPATQTFSPGQVVDLLGPVGKPIPLRESVRKLLLMAYDSTPSSLLLLAETALAKGIAVTLALIGTATQYPLELLPQEIEIVRGTDKGDLPDKATTLRWADQIVAVAPPPSDIGYYARLLDAVREMRVQVPSDYVFGLLQPPMPCGVGACQACVVRVGRDEVPACLYGPAFDLLSLRSLPTESA